VTESAAAVRCHAAFGGFAAFGRDTTRRRHDDNDVVIATGHEVRHRQVVAAPWR
jgi:hypothetical protein